VSCGVYIHTYIHTHTHVCVFVVLLLAVYKTSEFVDLRVTGWFLYSLMYEFTHVCLSCYRWLCIRRVSLWICESRCTYIYTYIHMCVCLPCYCLLFKGRVVCGSWSHDIYEYIYIHTHTHVRVFVALLFAVYKTSEFVDLRVTGWFLYSLVYEPTHVCLSRYSRPCKRQVSSWIFESPVALCIQI